MSESKHRYWSQQLENLANEMSRLCIVCDIQMLEPGVAERVLKGDEGVCGRKNSEVFDKLRKHLAAFIQTKGKAIGRLGVDETRNMLDEVRGSIARLRGKD